jgi:predicted house-cleaning noncanonical NTP pyrophosphatase (MazG superfamily)
MTQTYRFKLDKLIRDKLPQMMRKSGITVSQRIVEKDEYLNRLKDKLIEEAKEVLSSESEQEICEELADVLEVMLALLKVYGREFTDIQKVAQQKRAEKGGFDDRTYVNFVEMDAQNPSLEYYKARLDQYPSDAIK